MVTARSYLAFLFLLVFTGCVPALASVPTKATVFVVDVKPQPLADVLTYPGRVKSRLNAVNTSEIEGQIIEIHKTLGSKIQKGDVILTMQNTDPVYRYAPIKVRSASSGFLTSLEVSLMAKVDRGQKLFTVTDPKNLLVEVEVPARDLAKLSNGLKGTFKASPMDEASLPVQIEGLSPLIDMTSGTATAQLKFNSSVDQLRQGQLGQVHFETNSRQAFVLPESTLVYRDEKPYVRILKDGKVSRTEVVLGKRNGDSYEIVSGLKPGQQIITRASRFVTDGEEVEVKSTTDLVE